MIHTLDKRQLIVRTLPGEVIKHGEERESERERVRRGITLCCVVRVLWRCSFERMNNGKRVMNIKIPYF